MLPLKYFMGRYGEGGLDPGAVKLSLSRTCNLPLLASTIQMHTERATIQL